MNLFLSIIWAAVGIALVVFHTSTNDPRGRLTMFPGEPSAGWLALILALYNYVRHWSTKSARQRHQQEQLLEAEQRERLYRERRQRENREREPRERDETPDPNFDFTDAPEKKPDDGPDSR